MSLALLAQQSKKLTPVLGLVALAACAIPTSNIDWGNDSSAWAFDGECDDPRFTGPGAHSLLLAEDVLRDATDCRRLYERGLIRIRENFQPGINYENAEYDPSRL